MENQSFVRFLLNRHQPVNAWQKIPWHDPDFSRRMLKEHLTQDHDLASRRYHIIDKHVAWIHHKVLGAKPASILDLGCGPGLYMSRLSKLGHFCTGIDISPASIEYARREHAGTYRLGNVLTEPYGSDYDLVMLVYGELNAFSPADVKTILDKAHGALKSGGKLLLEVSYAAAIELHARQAPGWYAAESGLFSDKPHLCLQESHFGSGCQVTNFYILEEGCEEIQTYTVMHQVYTDDEYRQMLQAFERTVFYPSLTGKDEEDGDFFCIVATK
jgi:SAM-dependent methyltransferase